MSKNKFYVKEFLLVNFFLLDLSAASISHYITPLFILKAVCSIILILLILYDITIMKASVKTASAGNEKMEFLGKEEDEGEGIFSLLKSKRLNFIFGIITAWFALTLLYSTNAEYGALKLLNFTVSTIPAVYAFYYLGKTFTHRRMKVLIISFIVLSFVSVIAVLAIWPFHYLGSFNIALNNWSHVIYGRFIGSIFIILLLILFSETERKKILFISAGILFSFMGLLLSGYRGGILAAAVTLLASVVFLIIKGKLRIYNLVMLLAAFAAGFLILIVTVKHNSTLTTRYLLMQDYDQLKFKGDQSIQSHMTGYRVAYNMFKDSPVWGEGFGSFKNHYNNRVARFIEYPHNIFLEFAAELGVFGIVFFLMLLYLIFYYAYKWTPLLMFYFLFALILAQFSKDITSNVMLWLGLAFPALLPIKKIYNLHKSFPVLQ